MRRFLLWIIIVPWKCLAEKCVSVVSCYRLASSIMSGLTLCALLVHRPESALFCLWLLAGKRDLFRKSFYIRADRLFLKCFDNPPAQVKLSQIKSNKRADSSELAFGASKLRFKNIKFTTSRFAALGLLSVTQRKLSYNQDNRFVAIMAVKLNYLA